jgi:hypothetical protein
MMEIAFFLGNVYNINYMSTDMNFLYPQITNIVI